MLLVLLLLLACHHLVKPLCPNPVKHWFPQYFCPRVAQWHSILHTLIPRPSLLNKHQDEWSCWVGSPATHCRSALCQAKSRHFTCVKGKTHIFKIEKSFSTQYYWSYLCVNHFDIAAALSKSHALLCIKANMCRNSCFLCCCEAWKYNSHKNISRGPLCSSHHLVSKRSL